MRRKSGFTLLELLITTMLFAALAATLTAVFSTSSRLYFLNRHNQTVSLELQAAADYLQEIVERAINIDPNYPPSLYTTLDPQCTSVNCAQPNNLLFLYTRRRLENGTISTDPADNHWTAMCVQTGSNSRRQLTVFTVAGDRKGTVAFENRLASDYATIPADYDYDGDGDLDNYWDVGNCTRIDIAYFFFTDIRPLVIWDDPATTGPTQNEEFAPGSISNPQFINQRSIDMQNIRIYPINSEPAGTQPIGYSIELTAQTDLRNQAGIEIRSTDDKAGPTNVTVRVDAYRMDPNYINRAP